jgi:hypothetical protein
MQGNYQGTAPFLISPVQGIQTYVKYECSGLFRWSSPAHFLLIRSVTFTSGCDNVACGSTTGFDAAKTAASAADAVVLIIGLDQSQEREGHDRDSIAFPGNQVALAQAVGITLNRQALPSLVCACK